MSFMGAGAGHGAYPARAYLNGAFTLTANQWTKIPLDTIDFDPGGNFDLANSRYVCMAGIYVVCAQLDLNALSGTQTVGVAIFKNGSSISQAGGTSPPQANIAEVLQATDIVQCAAGDYLELYGYSTANQACRNTEYQANYLAIGG